MCQVDAYHEAGHAFMAIYLGGQVRSVTITPDNDDGPDRFGDVQVLWHHDQFTQRELCENMVRVALAGPVAEMIHRGEPLHPGFVAEWSTDWTEAWQTAAALHTDEKRRLAYLEKTTVRTLSDPGTRRPLGSIGRCGRQSTGPRDTRRRTSRRDHRTVDYIIINN